MTTTSDRDTPDGFADAFGTNSWLVDEMYERYRDDPTSVGDAWREFFADYRGADGAVAPVDEAPPVRRPAAALPEAAPTPPASVTPTEVAVSSVAPSTSKPAAEFVAEARAAESAAPPATVAAASSTPSVAATGEPGVPIRGAGAAIAANMQRSLQVPTATSFRDIPAKLVEVNRKVINGYRTRTGMGKVSFTHLIGYAVVRAIADAVPVMRNTFAEGADGKPRLIVNDTVNMGLAVDMSKPDGSHSLVVPVIKGADAMTFREFLSAYEDLIRKVKSNKLTVDDFQGANVSLTNPGTIGTVQSVPRLMPGQGVIVGVGSIDFPAEFQGADPQNLATMGVSKVVTVTSTYDHRIIQGAESGLFLKRVHELLLGEHRFFDDLFASLDMPYKAVA